MNAEHFACASSAAVEHWDQIDWKRCERQVTRLQARIVKASREGRWGKVRCLQRLLTCSFSGKALAGTLTLAACGWAFAQSPAQGSTKIPVPTAAQVGMGSQIPAQG